VIVRSTAEGDVLEAVQIVNDVDRLTSVIARAGESPEVVLGGDVRLVLGGRRAAGGWRDDASSAPAGSEGV
jgi:hypothetical protein